jgi:tRNA pseudouridine55 synthase
MRKRKGQSVHGWLVLDKPEGVTSTAAVGRLKRLFDARKAGHAGTLDPLATGILPIAFGEATKTVPYIVDGTKGYRFTVRWGAETDTDDREGRVVGESGMRPVDAAIRAAARAFVGVIQQVPPRYSAIKIEGERAYDLARGGAEFEIEARAVAIEALDLVDAPDAETAVFEARCGKGTYVRALARDMGRALGCLGHVTALRRTRVGPFAETDATGMSEIERLAEGEGAHERLRALLRPVQAALSGLDVLNVSPSDAARITRGQAVLLRGAGAPIMSGAAYATSRGSLLAIGEIRQGEFTPTRVFAFGG